MQTSQTHWIMQADMISDKHRKKFETLASQDS